jgi:hypothetical protein
MKVFLAKMLYNQIIKIDTKIDKLNLIKKHFLKSKIDKKKLFNKLTKSMTQQQINKLMKKI